MDFDINRSDDDAVVVGGGTDDYDYDYEYDCNNTTSATTYSVHNCDESKCVSSWMQTGHSMTLNNNGGDYYNNNIDAVEDVIPIFKCYAENSKLDPYICADGYKGFAVPDELPISVVDNDDTDNDGTDATKSYKKSSTTRSATANYYTCCPPILRNNDNNNNNNNNTTTTTNSTNTSHAISGTISPSSSSLSSSNTSTLISTLMSPYQRHCSDTIAVVTHNNDEGRGKNNATILCGKTTDIQLNILPSMKYRRNMPYAVGYQESFLCCDEELVSSASSSSTSLYNNNNTNPSSSAVTAAAGSHNNFLDDVECIPYLCTDFFYDCVSENRFGVLESMACTDNTYNQTFVYPRRVARVGNDVRFVCCRTGTIKIILPRQTPSYYISCGIALFCASVSVVFISILIVSLLKPLIINKLKRQTTTLLSLRREQQQQHGEQVHDEQQEQHQQEEQEVNDSHSQYRTRNRQQQQQYSPYNLYLVFATIPDLFFGAYLVWRMIFALIPKYTFGEKWWVLLWNGSEVFLARGTLIYANIVMSACVGASICVNAVIAFEVFSFLKACNELTRYTPPSSKKVTLQSMGVYLFSFGLNAIYFLLLFFSQRTNKKTDASLTMEICVPLLCLFLFVGPFIFLLSICFLIWKRGYIRTTDRALKVLAIYFLRIVFVFILFYIPIMVMSIMHGVRYSSGDSEWTDKSKKPLYAYQFIMMSLQSLFTCYFALKKPDVKRMVLDLFTCCCCNDRNNDTDE